MSQNKKHHFKVIHLELKQPYKGHIHFYFGSKSAIYEHLPEDLIGIKLESLWNINLDKDYINQYCIIRKGTLKRKSTLRGVKSNKIKHSDS